METRIFFHDNGLGSSAAPQAKKGKNPLEKLEKT
jgi:hypothetical protein